MSGSSPVPAPHSNEVTDVAAVDAAWMTRALDEAGVARGAAVTAVDARPIGTGQVAENVRFALTWSATDDGAERPTSVVAKVPSTDPVSLQGAAATNTYVREVGFYRDLQRSLPVPTPVVLRIEEQLADHRFLLLMEDVAPAEQGDQLAGCGLDRAELAIDAAAALHAATWDRAAELVELSWVDLPTPESGERLVGLYEMLFPVFAEWYSDRLTADQLDLGRWIGEHVADLIERRLGSPLCLAHGDFRLDNMLFATGPGIRPLTVVDWQTAQLGSGPADVAYFVGAGLLPADRRRHEDGLIDRYHRQLVADGVGVERDDVVDGYKVGTMTGYFMAVVASQLVVRTERGDDMFMAMATRHADQMLGVDLPGLLG